MKLKNKLPLIPVLLLLGTMALAWAPGDEAYDRGRDALDQQKYKEAFRAFRESAERGGDQSDAASYWLAYTMARMDRQDEALDQLSRFHDEHADSRWSDDARRLAIELSQEMDPDVYAAEELKLIALHGLVGTDPESAGPRLEKFLREAQSPSMKEEALFLLLQSGAPGAKDIALDLARSSPDAELRIAAIHSLATLGELGTDDLAELYDSMDSVEGKMAILEGYMMNGDVNRMLDLARNETDIELRRAAIEFLAASGAVSELEGILEKETSPELRGLLLEAYMISGQLEPLKKVALGNGPAELRRTAIEFLGMLGESETLKDFYRSETDPELRAAALEGLAVSGDHAFLRDVLRNEKVPEIRAEAIRALSYSGNGDSDTLVSIYRTEEDPEVREAALEGLMMQGDAKTLIELARAENDPANKKAIVEMLASIGSKESIDYLMELIDD